LPGQWEHLPPVALVALQRAWEWRRSQDVESLAVAVTLIVNAIPLRSTGVGFEDVVRSFPGYIAR